MAICRENSFFHDSEKSGFAVPRCPQFYWCLYSVRPSVRNAFLKIIEYGNSDGWNHSETVLLLNWHRINAKMLAVWLTGPLKKKDMQDFNNFSHNYARKLIDATLFSYRDIQRECAILLRHNAETLHFSIKKQIDWRFLNIIY